jgi:hypothetical protein
MDYIDSHHTVSIDEANIRYKQYVSNINDKLKNHEKPHNKRWKQGFFIPKNPLKWINIMETDEPLPIVYRSGWEKQFYEWMDTTNSIYRCGVEIIKILYKNPIQNKMSFYVPDAYMEYYDTSKQQHKVLVEIKPLKEASLKEAKDGYDRLLLVKNSFKWQAAILYCKKRGIEFKVMHEHNLGVQ